MATETKLLSTWKNMPGGSFSLILTHTGVLDTQDSYLNCYHTSPLYQLLPTPSNFDHGVHPEWDSALPNFGDRFKDMPYDADGNVKAAGEGGMSGELPDDDVDPEDTPGLSANSTVLKVNGAMIKAYVTSHIADELDTSTTAPDDSNESVFFFTDSDSESESPYIELFRQSHTMAWQGFDVLGRPRHNPSRVDYSENKRKRPTKQASKPVDTSGENPTVQPVKDLPQPPPSQDTPIIGSAALPDSDSEGSPCGLQPKGQIQS
jgi:hypothetical protein